jgi:hypothetical protein
MNVAMLPALCIDHLYSLGNCLILFLLRDWEQENIQKSISEGTDNDKKGKAVPAHYIKTYVVQHEKFSLNPGAS